MSKQLLFTSYKLKPQSLSVAHGPSKLKNTQFEDMLRSLHRMRPTLPLHIIIDGDFLVLQDNVAHKPRCSP